MFLFNGTKPKKITFNGKNVKKLIYNGVEVWLDRLTTLISGALPLTLLDCTGENAVDYTISGNATQSIGEYDATSGKYKIPVVARGKNLFDISKINNATLSNGGYITNNQDGSLAIGGTYTVNSFKTLKELCPLLKVGDVAVLSAESNAINKGDALNRIYVADGTTLYFNRPFTVTQALLDNKVLFYSFRDTNNVISESYYKNIQIEIGEAVTDCEEYKEPITTNIYLDEPLSSGDGINYKEDNLPPLPTLEGTTVYETRTEVQPNMEVAYYQKQE